MFYPIASTAFSQEGFGLAITLLSLIIAPYANYTDAIWTQSLPVSTPKTARAGYRRIWALLGQATLKAIKRLGNYFGVQVVQIAELERQQAQLQSALLARTNLTTAARAQQQALDEAQRRLQTLQSQLIQAEKLSGLGQIVAEVAHDINNPIGLVHGNLAFVEQYVRDLIALIEVYHQRYPQHCAPIQNKIDEIGLSFIRQDLPEVLASMQIGIERIQEITKSLTRYSRMDQSAPTLTHIQTSIETTLRLLRPRLTGTAPSCPPITITSDYGALLPIHCFPGQIGQVMMNIVSNAIDALQASPRPSPTVHIKTRQLNTAWVRVTISDNGPGMSLETQAKLYDPFYTTKPKGQGTGLGLAISRQIIVEHHRGRLCSHSGPDGTTFEIDLPVHPTAAFTA